MENPEYLEFLKQGVEVWNKWRKDNPDAKINLRGADLCRANLVRVDFHMVNLSEADLLEVDLWGANLKGADLRKANLSEANLSEADLWEANLSEADLGKAILLAANLTGADLRQANLLAVNLSESNLFGADLRKANLSEANLVRVDFYIANLSGANLTRAILEVANIRKANLSEADLWGANLFRANLSEANLSEADLSEASLMDANLWGADLTNTKLKKVQLANTILANLNLNKVKGLEEIFHRAPSQISTDTIQRTQGNLPDKFLRGCGLSDFEIENARLYNPNLSNHEINDIVYKIYDLRAKQSIQISPLFISYNHNDNQFVEEVEEKLDKIGVRYWRDVHHAIAGPLEKQVDRAIRLYPTVILILSENSVQSDWVEHEVRTSRELAKELGRDVLCPVALDDSWKDSPWPERVMEQVMEYNILDFSGWKDKSVFEKQFRKLLDGLDLFYK